MSSLLLALALTAWPLPRDAGAAEYAAPANWPQEPEWNLAWPLYSFTPAGWAVSGAEQDAGVGMKVDRAWSVTRGSPGVVLGIVSGSHALNDPTLALAWRLSPGEAPDAGDVNGNGRLDVGDFAADPRVSDVNANGALDLEDVLAGLADGVDQDGNGRVDDLCGWDFALERPLATTRDGTAPWRALAAPVGDGLPGIGVCPGCTLLPVAASGASLPAALRFAADAGVRALLLPASEAELSAALDLALTGAGQTMVLVTEGSGGASTFPLALHPAVLSPRTLTAPPTLTTAIDRGGCGGAALAGSVSVSSTGCAREAAASLVGLAGLIFSVRPSLEPRQVVGLLGGARVDAERAVLLAETALPPAIDPVTKLKPVALGPFHSDADACEPAACDAGAPRSEDPAVPWVRFVERQRPYEWSTTLPSPHPDSLRGLLGVSELGAGSGPPRFVDLDGLDSDTVLAASPRGLMGFTSSIEVLSPALSAGRAAPAFGDVDGDRVLDVVTIGDDGLLQAQSFSTRPVAGFPVQLDAGLAGPPLLIPTFDGTALVTVDLNGSVTHTVGETAWRFELGAPQVSAPAAGFIDGDAYADLAIANGLELRVLINDTRGPTPAGWTAPTRATQALLGNLVGDAELEIVTDRVFDARGQPILELDGWTPPVVPPALARLDRSSNRALIQVERRPDGLFELTRYDVERALRAGDLAVARVVVRTLGNPPARGGFAVADVTGDRNPDVLLPTEDGLLFIIDGEGLSPFESPLPTHGTVLSSPAVGVARDQLEFAVRTTRGDLVRWLGRGPVEDISWESAGHDRANTWNAETKLPPRRLGGLGITEPPILEPRPCSCSSPGAAALLGLLFLFRRRRRT
ncbi:MAG: hypothetical protein Q8L48_07025 [Archangium sp.]|nr:hypothetical protein [Archangium sp.]